ncbi:DUF1133 family protein [Salmonella enterica subsp. enterica serovar Javiana]|uniref:DUF1133 domain-containing protein n=1 Tax=Salmonella enterica subsp. enterica serovar Reading TaxID=165302 RepID=A0A644RGP4_SALET|nr:DUF1133 family protein [Salmonella enterica]EAA6335206.1 DUF1133 family protein [Salmonella enterica subsp. enterica serovar Coeln]EAA6647942.1 DUF1133 family protein [Salmonella enterica subsp. enterica serovar Reading]EAP2053584.1 DUF1133 family protein [Salmonella enterica subsp. enterica serovar 4,[5],12:i:-]EBH2620151.1 DUF1133 family protein [Salmonella enterica subsp. enterica]EBV9723385.1 DUF1133 family protein [Salmonella enterica subsp. enterica serovar Typhimurium var. 5-]ECP512
MINPSEVGKSGEMVRLRTLESIWIQGKLRMWGRWSYIGGGSGGNMFNQLLASGKITKTAINEALRRMKKAGISKPELEAFFKEIQEGNNKSGLAFCTDEEALAINAVLCGVLVQSGHKKLYALIEDRYIKRLSKKAMARNLNEKHPEWCLRTCESRIDVWLNVAESMLYKPMCDTFGTNSDRFYLNSCAESA